MELIHRDGLPELETPCKECDRTGTVVSYRGEQRCGSCNFLCLRRLHSRWSAARVTVNLVGRTDTRQFVRLMYHADGVVCPVTFAMHLAAAVETKPGKPRNRAAVVIAGGREPAQWEAYPHHQYFSTNGALSCCDNGGCWKSRCQTVGDSDEKDRNLCLFPIQVSPELRIAKCMEMISAEDVIRRIEMYYEGGALKYNASDNPMNIGEKCAA